MNIVKAKTIVPINRNIIVKMDQRETETDGGIYLPEDSQTTNVWGTAVSVSDGCEDINKDDRVFVPLHVGTHIRIDKHDDVVIVDERKVLMREVAA